MEILAPSSRAAGRKNVLRVLGGIAPIVVVVVVVGTMMSGRDWTSPGGSPVSTGSGHSLQQPLRSTAPSHPPGLRAGERWTSPIDGREMVWVPAGEFDMGSPASEAGHQQDETQHRVRIDRGFWMDATEVSNAAYAQFVEALPAWQKGRVSSQLQDGNYLNEWNGAMPPRGREQHPVVWVSWHAARAYCGWAGKRLPTEAEWEYAARAGTTTTYWWGDAFDGSRANEGSDSVPVGAKARTNPWGLVDMVGNVWERTSSAYRPYPYRSDDGREGPGGSDRRVGRGGSWDFYPALLRSAFRLSGEPRNCFIIGGFRCVQ